MVLKANLNDKMVKDQEQFDLSWTLLTTFLKTLYKQTVIR